MHAVFCIQELLSLIVNLVGERAEPRRPTLATLSRVCKAFSERALDELWHTQKSLFPILLLLLGGAIQVKETVSDDDDEPSRTLYLARPLTDEDIRTINKYAWRVRKTDFLPGSMPYALDISIVEGLKGIAQPLFPNLRDLNWQNWEVYKGQGSIAPFYSLLLTPKLSYLDIGYYGDELDPKLLDQESFSCLNLDELVLNGNPSESFSRVLNRVLPSFLELNVLRIDHHVLDWPAWCACASLPKLSILSVELNPMDAIVTPALWTHMPKRSLNITQLLLQTSDIQYITHFLTNATFPCLLDYSISIYQPTGPPLERRVAAFFSALAKACSPEILETIHILFANTEYDEEWRIPDGRTVEDYIIRPAALRPLFQLRRLRKLVLKCEWYWDLDNAIILDACKAWSRLEVLVLDPNPRWLRGRRRITLQALESLVEHAPNLFAFGATIDATKAPSMKSKSTTRHGKGHTKMQLLVLHHSSIDNAGDVAAFLSDLFPDLLILDAGEQAYTSDASEHWDPDFYDFDRPRARKWIDVCNMVRVLCLVRQEERRWVKAEDIQDLNDRAQVALARSTA